MRVSMSAYMHRNVYARSSPSPVNQKKSIDVPCNNIDVGKHLPALITLLTCFYIAVSVLDKFAFFLSESIHPFIHISFMPFVVAFSHYLLYGE